MPPSGQYFYLATVMADLHDGRKEHGEGSLLKPLQRLVIHMILLALILFMVGQTSYPSTTGPGKYTIPPAQHLEPESEFNNFPAPFRIAAHQNQWLCFENLAQLKFFLGNK
jgi:hypothetical protein